MTTADVFLTAEHIGKYWIHGVYATKEGIADKILPDDKDLTLLFDFVKNIKVLADAETDGEFRKCWIETDKVGRITALAYDALVKPDLRDENEVQFIEIKEEPQEIKKELWKELAIDWKGEVYCPPAPEEKKQNVSEVVDLNTDVPESTIIEAVEEKEEVTAWINGKYRTCATMLISVRAVDGGHLDCERILSTSLANEDADTRGAWRECRIGIDETTQEVLKVASADDKTLFEVLPPRPAPYGCSVKYQCAGGEGRR